MRKITLLLLSTTTTFCYAQKINRLITAAEAERIEAVLSSNEMQGRKTGSPGIDKAADFISSEFRAAGLKPIKGADNYLQQFTMVRPRLISASATLAGKPFSSENLLVITSLPEFKVTETAHFDKVYIKAGANLGSEAQKYIRAQKDYLVIVDTSFSKTFGRLVGLRRQLFESDKSVVFMLTASDPMQYSIEAKHEITKMPLTNVVGMLPGKKATKKDFVVFSGHYDHLGIGRPVNNDSIYNGANDDAAGITAVIMLAKYFKALKKPGRTLVFAAFTAEEIGGFGSQYFSQQLPANDVVAMFNIEMIGTESKWGRGSAYITGYEKTDMGKILEKNLQGSSFKFYPDPYTQENLFYRSDNATLARLGVPAHTISTSKMDSEPNYHKPSDELSTLDLQNMAEVIKAIAISSRSIISGKDSPTRVNTTDLR